MSRIARAVYPGYAHHITQRGNRRQQTFFCDDDYRFYLDSLAERCNYYGVEIWAYCLMPNHIHLIAVPSTDTVLSKAIGDTHRRYTRMVNFRENWRGYLWQGRFSSFPMDDGHLMAAARYIELNPVRAQMAAIAADYKWSSAAAHIAGGDDPYVKTQPLLDRAGMPWENFLLGGLKNEDANAIRHHEKTGRPLGAVEFIEQIQKAIGRAFQKRKPGPRPRTIVRIKR